MADKKEKPDKADQAAKAEQSLKTDAAAKAKREGKGMSAGELAEMEIILKQRWRGDAYAAGCDAVEKALAKAGDKGSAWLRQAIRASGPTTAAHIMLSIAATAGRNAGVR